MNIAHILTVLRIVISPLFPLLYLKYHWFGISFFWVPWILLFLLFISEFSDLFDGFFARKRNQVTDLGKVLDPMADSITHISLFLTFTQGVVELPLLLVLLFLYREFFVSMLRTLCALRGVALAARFSGKVKTVIQGVTCALILAWMIPYTLNWISLQVLQTMSLFFTGAALLYTLLSVWDYIYANRFYIKKALGVVSK